LERGTTQAGREPKAAAASRRRTAEGNQRLHRIVGELFRTVERLHQREAGNCVEIVGHNQLAVVAHAQREAGEIDEWRNADGNEYAAQDGDGRVAVRSEYDRVGPDDHHADLADFYEKHPVVFDGRARELHQATGNFDLGAAVAQRNAFQVERPSGRVVDVGEWNADGEFVHLRCQPRNGDAAVDQQPGIRTR